MYATGVGVARNYSKALVYTSFATIEGDLEATHMLGYWHFGGVGVQKNCERSIWYYEKVADKLFEIYKSGPPGGIHSPGFKVFLYGKHGGIYGKEASGAGNPVHKTQLSGGLRESDILLLYRLQAESGDAASQYLIGQYYYMGSQSDPRDFKKAMHYFKNSAKQYPSQTELDSGDAKIKQTALAASQSAGYIGEMYWRGEGVEANAVLARKWFERGSMQDNWMSKSGLGMMYLNGEAGLEKNIRIGVQYLELAASHDHPNAMIKIAELLMGIVNIKLQTQKILMAEKIGQK